LWASSNVPGSATGTTNTDTATFNLAAGVAVTTTANWNIENITFSGAATASYNIGTAALALTAGGTITDSITGTVPEYITAPLTLQGAYSVTDTAATSNLNMSGAITGSSTFNLSGSSGTNASYGTIYVGSLTNFTGTLNVLTGSEDSVYNTAAADNATSQTINIGTSNTSSATFATSQNIGSGVTVNVYGTGYFAGTGALTIENSATEAGAVNIKSSGVTLGAGTSTGYISGLITDNGNGFMKINSGTLALDYNGSSVAMSGPITIANGILEDLAPLSGTQRNELGTGTITIGYNGSNATLLFAGVYNPTAVANTILIKGTGTDVIQTTEYNPQITGSVTLSNNLTLASGGSGSTTLTLSGGITGTGNVTISITGTVSTSSVTIGSGGINNVGTITENTATVNGEAADTAAAGNISGPIGTNMSGITLNFPTLASTLTLSGNSTYTHYTNISSGTLAAGVSSTGTTGPLGVGSPVYLANAATAALNLNNYNVAIGSLTGGGSSGGNINLGSGTLTVGSLAASTVYAGVISGTGGLTVTGGNLNLSGASTFTGATNISGGTLTLTNAAALGKTAVTVNTGGTLLPAISTTIGNSSGGSLTLAGGTLNLLASTSTVLTDPGAFNISGSSIDYLLGSVTSSNSTLNISGAATISGSNTINLSDASLPSGTSTFTLITAAGGGLPYPASGSATGFTIGSKPSGLVGFALTDTSANTLLLTVTTGGATPASAYWTGLASTNGSDTANNWTYNLSSPALQTNWSSNPAGTSDTDQVPGPTTNVYFTAANAASTAGALSTQLDANYSIASLIFDTSTTSSATTPITSVSLNTNGYTLTIGTSGLIVSSTDISSTTITGSGAGILIGGNQNWDNNNNSFPLTINTGVNGAAASGTYTLNLNGTGTGGVIFNNAIGDGSAGGKLALSINQVGTTQLNASSTFTGGTTILSGTVQIGASGALGTGSVQVAEDTTASLLINGSYTLSNTITTGAISSGVATIGSIANGNAVFSGLIVEQGSTTISQVATTGTNALSITGGINSSNLGVITTFAGPGTINVSGGAIANGGYYQGIAVTGGTLNLSAPSTYTGSTNISGGIVNVGVGTVGTTSGPLGVGSAVILANSSSAALNLNNFNVSIGSLTGGGASGGNITLGSGNLTIGTDNTSPAAYSGNITGTGGIIKTGTGTLTLSGSDSFSTTTTINGGTLALGSTTALPASSTIAFTNTNNSAGLNISALPSLTLTNMTFGTQTNGSNTVTISGGGTTALTVSPSTLLFAPLNSSSGFTVSMSTLGSFTYNNSAGTFQVSNGTNTGAGTASVTLSATTNSITSSTLSIANAGGGTGGCTSYLYLGATNTINANTISIGASTGRSIGYLQFASGISGGTVTIAGTTGGTSTANLTLGTNYTYGGDNTAYGGTLNTASGTLNASFGTMVLGNAVSSSGEPGGNSNGNLIMGLGTITANTANLANISGSSSNSTSGTYSSTGNLNISGGTASITTITMGTDSAPVGNVSLTENTTITLSSGATLNATTIQLGATTTGETHLTRNASINMSNGSIGNKVGSNLSISGVPISLASGTTNNFNISSGQTGTISSVIGGSGSLSTTGTGTVVLSGSNTYTGNTNISAGTLTVSGAIASTPVNVASGATLTVASGGNISTGTNLTDAGTVNFNNPARTIASLNGSGAVNLAGTALNISNGGTFSGVIADNGSSGSLIASGGTLTLSGASTFSGGTNLSAGTLIVANTTGSATGTGNVTLNAGTLASGTVGTISGAVTAGSGAHSIAPGGIGTVGTLTLSGVLTTSNLTTINFDLGAGPATLIGSNEVVSNGDLLTLGSAPIISSGTALSFGGTPTTGDDYRLIGDTTSGTIVSGINLSNFSLPTPPTGDTYTLSTSVDPGYIDLVVATSGPANLTWNNAGGTGDGITWDITTNQNWNNGTAAAVYHEGDKVTFNDSNNYPANPNAYSVTLNTIVHPTSVTVSTAGSYSITGSGGIADVTSGHTPLTVTGTGSLTLGGSNTYTGGTTVGTGSDTPTLNLSGGSALPANSALTINTGATVNAISHGSSPITVLQVSALTNTGTLNLTNNDLVVRASAGLSLAQVTAQVAAGYNGGTWTNTVGSVITSSTAAGDTTYLTALGVATGSAVVGGSIDGVAVASGDLIVKYTYYGDTNLDGAVDGSDYTNIDNGFNTGATGWQNGDFNYDGVVDGSDYTLIDNAYNMQGTSLGTSSANLIASATAQIAGGSSAVPEPTTLGMLGIGAVGLLARRKRKHSGN
jgi:autotransporter-associated beta strand protein